DLACCNSYQLFQAWYRAGPLSIRNPRGMMRGVRHTKQPGDKRSRLGQIRCQPDANEAWRKFSSDLAAKIPPENSAVTELSHSGMLLVAYRCSGLSNSRNDL